MLLIPLEQGDRNARLAQATKERFPPFSPRRSGPPAPTRPRRLTRVAAAAGLALLLSACGGGGGGAGAPNAGATLGGSAPSIQAGAAVAPAPVAEQATPVAKKTAPVARNSPPGDGEPPPPTNLPPVSETTPPQTQEPSTPNDRNIVTDPSTIPFPSGSPVTDEKVNMNMFSLWGLPVYQPGGASAARNNGPNVAVRRRVGYSKRLLSLPVSGGFRDLCLHSPVLRYCRHRQSVADLSGRRRRRRSGGPHPYQEGDARRLWIGFERCRYKYSNT